MPAHIQLVYPSPCVEDDAPSKQSPRHPVVQTLVSALRAKGLAFDERAADNKRVLYAPGARRVVEVTAARAGWKEVEPGRWWAEPGRVSVSWVGDGVQIETHMLPVTETTRKARAWISAKIRKLRAEGKPLDQAVAIALNMARKKGFKVGKNPNEDWGRPGGLVEVFDQPESYRWLSKKTIKKLFKEEPVDAAAAFKLGGQQFVVWFGNDHLRFGEVKTVGFGVVEVDEVTGDYWVDVSLTSRLGSKAVRVFSTVGKIVKDYVKKGRLGGLPLAFTAEKDEASRVKLYRRLAPELADELDMGRVTEEEQFGTVFIVIHPTLY